MFLPGTPLPGHVRGPMFSPISLSVFGTSLQTVKQGVFSPQQQPHRAPVVCRPGSRRSRPGGPRSGECHRHHRAAWRGNDNAVVPAPPSPGQNETVRTASKGPALSIATVECFYEMSHVTVFPFIFFFFFSHFERCGVTAELSQAGLGLKIGNMACGLRQHVWYPIGWGQV